MLFILLVPPLFAGVLTAFAVVLAVRSAAIGQATSESARAAPWLVLVLLSLAGAAAGTFFASSYLRRGFGEVLLLLVVASAAAAAFIARRLQRTLRLTSFAAAATWTLWAVAIFVIVKLVPNLQ